MRHALDVTLPDDDPDSAPATARSSRRLALAVKGAIGRLSPLIRGFVRLLASAVKRLMKDPFLLLGLASVLVLGALTARVGLIPGNGPFNIFVVIFVVVGFLLTVIDRKYYRSIFASTFGWLPVLLGAVSWPYWYWWGTFYPPIIPNTAFFETAAQVLPVLLLAAVIDVRRSTTLRSSQLTLPIIVVFLGEINALNATAFEVGTAPTSDFASVAASLTSTFIALILAVLADIASPDDDNAKTQKSPLPPDRAFTIPTAAQKNDPPDPVSPGGAAGQSQRDRAAPK